MSQNEDKKPGYNRYFASVQLEIYAPSDESATNVSLFAQSLARKAKGVTDAWGADEVEQDDTGN